MESTDAVIAGLALLIVFPLLFAEAPAYRRGGYNSAFWQKSLDEKLDHIAQEPRHWARMGAVWLPILVVSGAGMTAFSFQLAGAGSGAGTWAFLALGAFLLGAVSWVFGVLLHTNVVRAAASVRAETGKTPDWLDGFWNAGLWAEMTFVIGANVAAVLWGIGILDTGYPADWMGWAAIILGLLAILVILFTKEAFPHLGVFMPIVLGVALVLY